MLRYETDRSNPAETVVTGRHTNPADTPVDYDFTRTYPPDGGLSQNATNDAINKEVLAYLISQGRTGLGDILPRTYYEVTRSLGVAGMLQKETWWATDNGDGTYSDKAFEKVYTYSGISLMSRTETEYLSDGTVSETKTYGYFTTSDGNVVEKEI